MYGSASPIFSKIKFASFSILSTTKTNQEKTSADTASYVLWSCHSVPIWQEGKAISKFYLLLHNGKEWSDQSDYNRPNTDREKYRPR